MSLDGQSDGDRLPSFESCLLVTVITIDCFSFATITCLYYVREQNIATLFMLETLLH